jgi:hypothetical protein
MVPLTPERWPYGLRHHPMQGKARHCVETTAVSLFRSVPHRTPPSQAKPCTWPLTRTQHGSIGPRGTLKPREHTTSDHERKSSRLPSRRPGWPLIRPSMRLWQPCTKHGLKMMTYGLMKCWMCRGIPGTRGEDKVLQRRQRRLIAGKGPAHADSISRLGRCSCDHPHPSRLFRG